MDVRTGLWAAGLGLAAVIAAGPANAQTPKKGGTLIYMIAADAPPSFDGHRETTFATVHATAPFYSVLIRVPPDNPASTTEFVCDLCTEMPKPTDDGKTYTFKIRQDVKLHDGSKLTAADVADELEPHRLPAAGHDQRARQLLRHGRQDRDARRPDRHLPAQVRDDGVPAGARRSLHLHLQEGDPRQGSALVREEHHGLRPVQVRRVRDRPVDQGRAQPGLLSQGPALPRRHRGHLRRQAVGARRGAARRSRRHRVPRHAAVGARPARQGGRQQRSPSRTATGTAATSSATTTSASRSTTSACGARCRSRSTSGTARRRSPRSPPCARWAASSSRARRSPPPRRSCSRSPATGPTSRSRAPRRGGCSRRPAQENLKFELTNRNVDQPYKFVGTWLIGEWKKIGVTRRAEGRADRAVVPGDARRHLRRRGRRQLPERGQSRARYRQVPAEEGLSRRATATTTIRSRSSSTTR